MRRLARALALVAVAAALPHAAARPEPASPATRPLAEAASSPRPHALPVLAPPVRVIDVEPVGERVPLDAPLVVRFDADVAPGKVVELSPDLAGEGRWINAKTWSFAPKRWRPGRPQTVRVAVPGGEPVEWTFRARVPMPSAPAPGEGARA